MLNVFLFAIFSLPLIFILVAASISHFHTTAIKFPCNPSKVIGLLCFFISRSSSLSVFHVKADIRIKSKKRVGFVGVVFYLWNSGWLSALWRQKARVLEMQNFTPAYMKGGQTYGRTDDFLRTKFSYPWCSATNKILKIIIEFSENLASLSIFTSNVLNFLWK